MRTHAGLIVGVLDAQRWCHTAVVVVVYNIYVMMMTMMLCFLCTIAGV